MSISTDAAVSKLSNFPFALLEFEKSFNELIASESPQNFRKFKVLPAKIDHNENYSAHADAIDAGLICRI